MKKITLFLLLLISVMGMAQDKNINSYKYILVPMKFDFLKETNKYQLNIMTKFLFKKYGFNALMFEETLPNDLTGNRCNALVANLVEDNNLLVTKLKVVLKDCYGNIVFESKVGKSKEKDYKTAYAEALKEAFTSVEALHYKYDESLATTEDTKEVAVKPVEKVTTVTATTPVQVAESTNYLFAQPITNGYQLVDSTPKIVLKMFKTNQSDIFIASSDQFQGIVYKQNGKWILEYYKDQKLVTESLAIKF